MALLNRTHCCRSRRMVFAIVVFFATVGCRMPTPRTGKVGAVDTDAPAEFTTTASGLKYRILRRSEGKQPSATSEVKVDYVGWLDDGNEFDNSYSSRKPASFKLDQVIPAWTEGIQLVSKGGMIELEVPSHLGYGDAGVPGAIPPGATLHFKVELIDIQ